MAKSTFINLEKMMEYQQVLINHLDSRTIRF